MAGTAMLRVGSIAGAGPRSGEPRIPGEVPRPLSEVVVCHEHHRHGDPHPLRDGALHRSSRGGWNESRGLGRTTLYDEAQRRLEGVWQDVVVRDRERADVPAVAHVGVADAFAPGEQPE